MARPLRIQFPEAWYHVMNRGRGGEPVFLENEDYEAFIDLLKELVAVYNVRVVAYCLMSNHYHLLIQTPDANLSRAMRHLNGVYTQRFNRTHACDGQLFRGRYKSVLVDANTYLLGLVRYIHRNPIEAGLVRTLNRYPWSSHQGYLSDARKWQWLHKSVVLSVFSEHNRAESIRTYMEFIVEETSDKISRVFDKGVLPSVLGSESFVNSIKEKFFTLKNYEEIPESRRLAPDVERIMGEVCRFYEVDESELYRSRRGQYNEPRNIAIYLIRNLRCEGLREIGDVFGIGKISSVSSVIQRVKEGIRNDKIIRERVEELTARMLKSQEQT